MSNGERAGVGPITPEGPPGAIRAGQWNTDRNLARAQAAVREAQAARERDDRYRGYDHRPGQDGLDLDR